MDPHIDVKFHHSQQTVRTRPFSSHTDVIYIEHSNNALVVCTVTGIKNTNQLTVLPVLDYDGNKKMFKLSAAFA
jgi:hypothetical protein